MKVDLPDGAWASLRDPKKVPERLRRPVLAVLMAQGKNSAELPTITPDTPPEEVLQALDSSVLDKFSELNDLVVVALVEEWSYTDTPITADSVLDLPGDVYDALREAVAPFVVDLIPDFGPTPDPKARTGS